MDKSNPRGHKRGHSRGRDRLRNDGRSRDPSNAKRKVQITQTLQKGTVQHQAGSMKTIIIVAVVLVILIGVGVFLGVYFSSGGSESEVVQKTTTPVPYSTPSTPTSPSIGPATPSPYTDDKWKSIRGECGVPKQKPYLGRIVGGTEAVKHSWPWQIGLLKKVLFISVVRVSNPLCE